MGKLIRSVHSENLRLYSGSGALLALIAVFLISLCSAWIIGANSGENTFFPAIAERVNSSDINIPTEYTVEIIVEDNIQSVITATDISDSDTASTTDTPVSRIETHTYENWRDAYNARYAELTELNAHYSSLDGGYYQAKQQECVREALIIKKCLDADTPIGVSRAWNVVYLTLWLMLLPITLVAAAFISNKTAGEFKSGVMFTLYTLPVTRLKLYFAKLLSVSLFTAALCAVSLTGTVFGAMMGCGGIEHEGSYVRVLGEDVSFVSFFSHAVELTVCVLATVYILIAFCGAVSTLTRSQSAAITLTVLLVLAAMIFGKAVGSMGNIFCGLSVISVLDISAPIRSIPNYPAASYVVSWLTAVIYWLVFIIGGYLGMRRDAR